MSERPPLSILSGVRVLSFTQFLLGPSGVQFLADMGADVINTYDETFADPAVQAADAVEEIQHPVAGR